MIGFIIGIFVGAVCGAAAMALVNSLKWEDDE